MPEIEIINGPVTLWWAPVGESMPAIGSAPAGNWTKIGTSGEHNYFEDGVSIQHNKTTGVFRALGSGLPRKAFILEVDVIVTVRMADMTLAQLRLALNQNAVTDDTGFDSIPMDIGLDVNEIALFVRASGKSPLLSGGNLDFQFPRVFEDGSRNWNFSKGPDPAGADLTFRTIYDETNGAGLIAADDTA